MNESQLSRPDPNATQVSLANPLVLEEVRSGHRLMVQVQSTSFPLVDRNPQLFMNIFTAKPEDYRKATQRV